MDYLEYVKLAQKGDKQAFSALYNLYRDRLYHYAWYKIGNSEDAMDAVSDTILSAYEQIARLKNPKAFSSWLFKIHFASCNKYVSAVMKRREQADVDDIDLVSDTEVSSLSLELREALSRLDEQEREIVLLSVVNGFTSSEIARITDYTAGSVRSKQSRALAKMKSFLE